MESETNYNKTNSANDKRVFSQPQSHTLPLPPLEYTFPQNPYNQINQDFLQSGVSNFYPISLPSLRQSDSEQLYGYNNGYSNYDKAAYRFDNDKVFINIYLFILLSNMVNK